MRCVRPSTACFSALCLASILGAVLAGCGRGEPETIRIGVLVNMTGTEGKSTVEAAELAVSPTNAAGGIVVGGRKRRVELIFEDTRALPDEAIDGARRLVQRDVIAILGPSRSRDAIAVGGVVENARIPMICASSSHPETTAGKRYVFRVTFVDAFQGEALARFSREELGARTAAVLYDVASAYNRNLATVFNRAFAAAGGRMVAVETYTTGEADFSQQLTRIAEAEPQVLFLPNYYEDIPEQARQARALGLGAVLVGGDSWALISSADLAHFEGAFFGQHWHLDQAESHPQGERFVAAFRQTHGRDPSSQAALIYDAFGLLFRAIEDGGDDPDGIRQALAEIDAYPGVTGAITYRGTRGDPPRRLVIVQVQRGEAVLYGEVEP